MGKKMDPRYQIKHWQNPPNSNRASYWLVYGEAITFTKVDPYGRLLAIFRTRDEAEAWIEEQEGK